MLPPVVERIASVRVSVAAARGEGKRVGFVPTMGALHAGHAALVRAARAETDFVVVSVFVNPTQFGPNEDFNRYPRALEADRVLCGEAGADLIFAPTASEIYPPGFSTYAEVHGLQDVLEGASRPGHFRGVATVVLKLFNIVQPDVAWFGQKDAQQALIIRRMVRDLDVPIRVAVLPTVREPDGLALSSRNRYLDPEQRRNATALHRALEEARARFASGERDPAKIERAMADVIASTPGARLDYAKVVDADTLQPMETIGRPALAALAVYFGTTRLIDNTMLEG